MISFNSFITLFVSIITVVNAFKLQVHHFRYENDLQEVSIDEYGSLVLDNHREPAHFEFDGHEIVVAGTDTVVFVNVIDGSVIAADRQTTDLTGNTIYQSEGFGFRDHYAIWDGYLPWLKNNGDGTFKIHWTTEQTSNNSHENLYLVSVPDV